jgi:hypothetical protein
VVGRPRGSIGSFKLETRWTRRWKGETVGKEGRGVVCGKQGCSPPPVSVKDRWVGPYEQVLNVPIAGRWYEPGKPSSWLSTKACLFSIASLVVVGEKMSMDSRIWRSSSYGLCQEPFFSGVVDLHKSVEDFMKGCYAVTAWDTYGLRPYADWAWNVCGVLVRFSPAWCTLIQITMTLGYEYRLFEAVIM